MWRILALLSLAIVAVPQAFDAVRRGNLVHLALSPLLVLVAIGIWRRRGWTSISLATLAYTSAASLLTTMLTTNGAWLSSTSKTNLALSLTPAAVWLLMWSFAAYAAHRAAREPAAT